MKIFLNLLKNKDFKGLFYEPTDDLFMQLFRYGFVGGTAFIIDAASMKIFINIGVFKYLAVTLGFVLGLLTNFIMSKKFVFKAEKAKTNLIVEFISYGLIGLIGLFITFGLVYQFSDIMNMEILITKIIAAAIVLIWNFAARKILLYKKGESTIK